MKPSVYLETSIISYLTSQPSKDLVTSANQLVAHEWWNRKRNGFDLYISELVLEEAGRGDVVMARRRLELVADIPLLDVNEDVIVLAEEILRNNILPAKAAADISHIAIAAVHEVDFLLTLHCKHIANAFIYRRIERICRCFGVVAPIFCTPQEMVGKEDGLDEG